MSLSKITNINELLADLSARNFDLSHTPVDVEGIVAIYGVSIDDRYHPEHSDKVATVEGLKIWINPADANEYTALRRHIIAHELGHIVLHKPNGHPLHFMDTTSSLRGSGIDAPQEEAVCNEFAAELLIPTNRLIKLLTEIGRDVNDKKRLLQRVAEVFDVPLSLVEQRFYLIAKKAEEARPQ